MKRDPYTPDMFAVPTPTAPLPGQLNFGPTVRHLLSAAIKECHLSAPLVAARMSELIGHPISEHQLNSWKALSREAWHFPLEYLPAFEVAVETTAITAWLAEKRGGQLLVGRAALDAEIGRLERSREEAGKRVRELKKFLGDTE